MHVDAKRYLCAVDASYWATLSDASKHSLKLQGDRFEGDEITQFESLPFFEEAVRLRRYDDLAKTPGLVTPTLEYYVDIMNQVAIKH